MPSTRNRLNANDTKEQGEVKYIIKTKEQGEVKYIIKSQLSPKTEKANVSLVSKCDKLVATAIDDAHGICKKLLTTNQ